MMILKNIAVVIYIFCISLETFAQENKYDTTLTNGKFEMLYLQSQIINSDSSITNLKFKLKEPVVLTLVILSSDTLTLNNDAEFSGYLIWGENKRYARYCYWNQNGVLDLSLHQSNYKGLLMATTSLFFTDSPDGEYYLNFEDIRKNYFVIIKKKKVKIKRIRKYHMTKIIKAFNKI